MVGKKVLYLHIGSHKTGTTSIQGFLKENADEFSRRKIQVFQKGAQGEESINLASWFDQSSLKEKGALINPHLVNSINGSVGESVLVSSEVFSWVFEHEEIKKFVSGLHGFDEIRVIAYFRRQDLHVISHYQQAIRTKAERRFYLGKGNALPDYCSHYDKYFDYYSRIRMWADAVGKENVVIRKYEGGSLFNDNAVDDFLSVVGIKDKEGFVFLDLNKANKSSGWYQTKVAHLLLDMGLEPRSDQCRKILKALPGGGKVQPSINAAWEFYKRYRNSNKKLASFAGFGEEYFFDENFSFYPEKSQDIWDENSATEALKALIKVFV